MTLLVLSLLEPALAYSSGITGRSISGCGCHGASADATTTVSLSTADTTVAPGELITVTLTVSTTNASRTYGGLDVSASGGTLAAGSNTRLSSSEITHNSRTAMTSGAVAFNFTWTAPTTTGSYTLYGAGNAVNGSMSSGDGWNLGTLNLTVEESCTDADEDGVTDCDGDCDDSNAAVYPDADEICDDIDNDCDEVVDNDAIDAATWYSDSDGDTYGDASMTMMECDQPDGYVADMSDCDDTDASFNPAAADNTCDLLDQDCDGTADDAATGLDWYQDNDGDYFGNPDVVMYSCTLPDGYVANSYDCDDTRADTNEFATDDSCDGIDQNCDGTVDDGAVDTNWYQDSDGDGYGSAAMAMTDCAQPDGYVANMSDCDDTNVSINPMGTETCDGFDQDCDGSVDEDAVDAPAWFVDTDGDGYGSEELDAVSCEGAPGFSQLGGDCDETNIDINPGALEICDLIDQDCNGVIDDNSVDPYTYYLDADSDGYGDETQMAYDCSAPEGYVDVGGDCDDTNAAYNPGAAEDDCSDPNDYNCDGSSGFDDVDADGYLACEDCDDTSADAYPGNTEVCDGLDNNCDGTADDDSAIDTVPWYMDADADGYGDDTMSVNACSAPEGYAEMGGDCDDSVSTSNPGAAELCGNSMDDDCDGIADEDDAPDVPTWYYDSDGDGYGNSDDMVVSCVTPEGYVLNGGDCDDSASVISPGVTEACNGYDDNCDGTVDSDAADASMWYMDADTDGYGDGSMAMGACDQPEGYVGMDGDCDDTNGMVSPAMAESCNGYDDNCDGATDGADAVDLSTWYGDADADGYAGMDLMVTACDQPEGYWADATDCDDSDGTINPMATELCDGVDQNCDGLGDAGAEDAPAWYADADSDGYGDPSNQIEACEMPDGYVMDDSYDCDDANASINAGAVEACDGVDNDCDGAVDEDGSAGTYYADADGDGYGDPSVMITACGASDGYVTNNTDCNDGNASAYPGATEVWYDGVDGDCSGGSDYDGDADGYDSSAYGGTDCDDASATTYAGATDYWYDGIDADCAGNSDYDSDADGYDSASYGGDDCDDASASTSPGATEVWYDDVDQNCDGNDDDQDSDGYDAGDDCDDANSSINPDATENWYDGVDQNCDGNDDDQDGDGVSYQTDCDDADASVGEDCDSGDPTGDSDPLPGDSGGGGSDTGKDDGGGCGCNAPGGAPMSMLLAAGAGLLARRRRQSAS